MGLAQDVGDLLRDGRMNQVFALADGRRISLSEVGNPEGFPVFAFFGMTSHRYQALLFDEEARKAGLRLLCVDRPGKGLTYDPGPRAIRALDWPAVVAAIADSRRIQKFGLLAQSAGAVFALSVAHELPERVAGTVHLISPWVTLDCPSSSAFYKQLRTIPAPLLWLGVATLPLTARLTFQPWAQALMRRRLAGRMSPAEYASITQPWRWEASKGFVAGWARESGVGGFYVDVVFSLEKYQRFGFEPRNVRPSVAILHGSADAMVPPGAARWLAEQLPCCTLQMVDGGTHDLINDVAAQAAVMQGLAASLRGAGDSSAK